MALSPESISKSLDFLDRGNHLSIPQKLNAIVKFFENSCTPNWYVYLEAAQAPLGRLIVEVLTFGMDDVLRGAIRPVDQRRKPHARKGKGRGRRFKGIPELGEMFGERALGDAGNKTRAVGFGERLFWQVDGLTQRLLWYWLVADLATDFVYEWQSAILESETCRQQLAGFSHSVSGPDTTFFSLANAWTSILSDEIVVQRNGAESQFAAHYNSGKPFHATTSIEGTPIPGFSGELEIRAIHGSTAMPPVKADKDPKSDKYACVASQGSSGAAVFFQFRTNGGAYLGESLSTTFGA